MQKFYENKCINIYFNITFQLIEYNDTFDGNLKKNDLKVDLRIAFNKLKS